MINEVSMQLALRAKAKTLTVATTGVVSLAATATGYARTSGSFVTDGFWPGMEIVASGFGLAANNARSVVLSVTPLTLTALPYVITVNPVTSVQTVTRPPTVVEAESAGRLLTAGLPALGAWENVAFQPTAGVPWVREEFLPGPVAQVTLGPQGELEATPMYALHISAPAETGLTAKRYVDALRALFAPRTAIALANGDVLRVRSDTGPYAGQLQPSLPGFAVQPFTIPLRIRSFNLI